MSSLYKKSSNPEVIDKNINDLIAKTENEFFKKSIPNAEDLFTYDKLLIDLFNFVVFRDLEGLSSPDNSVVIGCKIAERDIEISLNYYTLTIVDKTNNSMIFGDSVCKADILIGATANAELITNAAEALRRIGK